MRRRMVPLAIGVLVGLYACGTDEPPLDPGQGPLDADAVVRPDLVVAQPPEVRAGAPLTLTFPLETERGIAWVLEERDGDTWHARYLLNSDGNNAAPTWVGPDKRDEWAWEDVGVSGPGPDEVLVPDVAAPGRYRLCTANAVSNFCAEVEIIG